GYDRIMFGEGITPEALSLHNAGEDIIVQLNDTPIISIFRGIRNGGVRLEEFIFDDGTVWKAQDIANQFVVTGSDENDVYDYRYSDIGLTLAAGKGNDDITGGKGDDTYVYRKGDGNDVIDDRHGNDSIVFEGISKHEVTASKQGSHLVITLLETGEKVRLEHWFTWVNNDEGRAYRHNIHFSDGEFTGREFERFLRTARPIDLSLQRFDYYSRSNMPGNVSVSGAGKQLDLTGDIWRRTGLDYTVTEDTYLRFEFKVSELGKRHVIGVDSNTYVSSGAGALFELTGDGTGNASFDQYFIDDHEYTANGDWQTFTIKVGDYFTGSGNNLVFGNLGDASTINSHFRNIQLFDVNTDGTTENDLLIGTNAADTLNGDAGKDTLIGRGGNDELKGGDGRDTYIYNLGDGKDTIIDS
ncbi:calcium-binding protein, partial [Agaribacter marinus]|uniref:calcium-binding protein n=1 Tax=Agaribacter marinus TaxID=1431249 RepID=UPI003D66410E